MQFLDVIAWVGAAISWWGVTRYLIEIKHGHTQPRLASWIAWASANAVFTVLAIMSDNALAAMVNGLGVLANLSVLTMCAVKRAGERPSGATDWVCLAITAVCLIWIILFPSAVLWAALLAMTANIAATWPTIRHAWAKPQEEAWQLFAANAGANGLGLVGVIAAGGLELSNIAGPLIATIGNVTLVSITLGRSMLTNIEEEISEVETVLAGELSVQPVSQED
jgi:hypothetical protein